jgi:mersacidin/lichenicidin family type 2 lantibiotic
MPTLEIVGAWKDEEYRDTLTEEQQAEMPEHPSGAIEFQEPEPEVENAKKGSARGSTQAWVISLFHIARRPCAGSGKAFARIAVCTRLLPLFEVPKCGAR